MLDEAFLRCRAVGLCFIGDVHRALQQREAMLPPFLEAEPQGTAFRLEAG